MKRYLKLVNFEFNRFFKLYLVLIGMTILIQMIGVIFESQQYLNRANKLIYEELIPKGDFIEQYGTMSFFNISQTAWFMGPIVVCGVILLIYIFFIWYRDWLGKNTFSYRLFMLPTARLHIYLAKATMIFLCILGMVAIQLLLIPVESQVLQWMVPSEFRTDLSVKEITSIQYLAMLFPENFIEFMLYYSAGIAAVSIIFTAIMFERAFRLKGVFYGILYIAVSLFILLVPMLVDDLILNYYFYPLELFFIELGTAFIVLAGAIWTGNFLIKNKVRV
ncbi:hypothetical protein [Bacillus sp. FSL K6-3431]|uniref:hypothetical protein n=1 Tax=Bacillus sp. FSL K6-3431 TaxID=2921500 RepID=UPI0030F5A10C